MSTKRERQRSDELDPDYDPYEEQETQNSSSRRIQRVQPSRQAQRTSPPSIRPTVPQAVTPAGNEVIAIRPDEHATAEQMDGMKWISKAGRKESEILCIEHRGVKKFAELSTHPRNEYKKGKQGFYCHDEAQAFWAFPLRNTKRLTCQHHCAVNDKIITRTVSIRSKKCASSHEGPCVIAIEDYIVSEDEPDGEAKGDESQQNGTQNPANSRRPQPLFSMQSQDSSSSATLERKWSSRRSSSRSRSRSPLQQTQRRKRHDQNGRMDVDAREVKSTTATSLRRHKKRTREVDAAVRETEVTRKRRRVDHLPSGIARRTSPAMSSRSTPTARGQFFSLFSLVHFPELEHVEELIRLNKLHDALEVLQNKLSVSNTHTNQLDGTAQERLYYFYLGIECHVGFAKCHYALNSYDSCITICSNVLARESSILPRQRFHCLYLRAMSRKKTMQFMDAFEDFEELSKGMARYFWRFSGDEDGQPTEHFSLRPFGSSQEEEKLANVPRVMDETMFHDSMKTEPLLQMDMDMTGVGGGDEHGFTDRSDLSSLNGVPDLPRAPFSGANAQLIAIPISMRGTEVQQQPPLPIPVQLQRSDSRPTTPKHIVNETWMTLIKNPSPKTGPQPIQENPFGTDVELLEQPFPPFESGLQFVRSESLDQSEHDSPRPMRRLSAPRLRPMELETTQEAVAHTNVLGFQRFDSVQDVESKFAVVLKSKVDKDMLRQCDDLNSFCTILHLGDDCVERLSSEQIILEDLHVMSCDDLCMILPPPIARHVTRYREYIVKSQEFWSSLQERTWTDNDDLGDLLRRYKLEFCAAKLVDDRFTIRKLRQMSVEDFRTSTFGSKYGLSKMGPRSRFQALLTALKVTEKPLTLLAHVSDVLQRGSSKDSDTSPMDCDAPPFLGIPDVPQMSMVERLLTNESADGEVVPMPAGLLGDVSEK